MSCSLKSSISMPESAKTLRRLTEPEGASTAREDFWDTSRFVGGELEGGPDGGRRREVERMVVLTETLKQRPQSL
jgi:hypothetical protein